MEALECFHFYTHRTLQFCTPLFRVHKTKHDHTIHVLWQHIPAGAESLSVGGAAVVVAAAVDVTLAHKQVARTGLARAESTVRRWTTNHNINLQLQLCHNGQQR